MSLRDLFVTIAIVGSLPFCFFRPWIGVLMWSWIGYMSPHKLTWGFARTQPFAQMVALVTLASAFLMADKDRRPVPPTREAYLFWTLWGIYLLSTIFALYPDEAWPHLIKVSKILLFIVISIKFCQTRERVYWLALVVALSLGFYGLKGGIWALRSAGGNQVLGPEGTFIEGNTEMGLALNMTLPFLYYMAREVQKRWLRNLLRTMFCFSIIAVIFTYSRGAVLGLPIVLASIFLRSRKQFTGIIVFFFVFAFIANFMDRSWFEKMGTVQTYEQDTSAMSRIYAWKLATEQALERPFTGGGFWSLPHRDGSRFGIKNVPSAHSIYFDALGDHGFPGLIVFVGLIVGCLAKLRSLRRLSEKESDLGWMANYCRMVEAGLIGYAVSGAFLSMAYFDLFYGLVSFVIILDGIVLQHHLAMVKNPFLKANASAPTPAIQWAPRLSNVNKG